MERDSLLSIMKYKAGDLVMDYFQSPFLIVAVNNKYYFGLWTVKGKKPTERLTKFRRLTVNDWRLMGN